MHSTGPIPSHRSVEGGAQEAAASKIVAGGDAWLGEDRRRGGAWLGAERHRPARGAAQAGAGSGRLGSSNSSSSPSSVTGTGEIGLGEERRVEREAALFV
jgi:hypothetical protein